MKTLIAAVFAFSTIGGAFAAATATTYKIDTAATKIEWVGKKVAGPHNGYVTAKSGEIVASNGVISAGTVVIDMKSITNTDLTDKEYNGKLVGHLNSKDFFDTEAHPEATLKIKNSKKTAKGLDVNADLTIKGITQPITFTATDVKQTADAFTAKSTITVDRTKYGVVYNAGKGDQSVVKQLGDKLIYDEFVLNVDLAAKK